MQYSKQEGPESGFEFSSVLGLVGRQFVSNFVLRISDLRLKKLFRISDFEFDLLS
jgi:hypothetical protein